jgi:hypothetical protein
MHSVLIVATVDRGHGDSVGGQVGGVPWEQPKVLVVPRSAPIVACSRGVGRRVDPRAAWNALHVEETEMKMMPGFHHLRERISHLTHDAWNSITTTTDHVRSTTLKFHRRTSGEPNSTSPQPRNRPH